MREALQITEGNLTSLIGVRYNNGETADTNVMVSAMTDWRDVVRKALSSFPARVSA
jgi:hypothetical protein